MSERQLLIHWLSQVAGRLRLIRTVQTLASLTLWWLALAAVYLALRASIPQREVLQALTPLIILSALGIAAYGVFRLARGTSLGEAADAADHAARLSDQIKSAYWFLRSPTDMPVVEVLMARAAHTVSRHDPQRLLPMTMPRAAWGSLTLALVVAALFWWSPVPAYSVKADDGRSFAVAAQTAKGVKSVAGRGETAEGTGDAPLDRTSHGRAPVNSAFNDPQNDSAEDDRASAGEERGFGGGLIPAAASEQPPAEAGSGARRGAQNRATESPSEWLGSVISRLKEMMNQEEPRSPGEASAPSGEGLDGARMGAADNGRRDDGGAANPTPEYRDADRSGLNDIRMNALGGLGPRNTIAGEGSGEEQSGRHNSNSGALGQRVGTSRAGAGDDSAAPRGNPGGEGESAPVLGKKTQRLALQLKRAVTQAKNPSPQQEDDEGTPEAFFSATRAQAARVQLQAVQASSQSAPGETMAGEQTPLAYRAVVKDYFLTQHRKEK